MAGMQPCTGCELLTPGWCRKPDVVDVHFTGYWRVDRSEWPLEQGWTWRQRRGNVGTRQPRFVPVKSGTSKQLEHDHLYPRSGIALRELDAAVLMTRVIQ